MVTAAPAPPRCHLSPVPPARWQRGRSVAGGRVTVRSRIKPVASRLWSRLGRGALTPRLLALSPQSCGLVGGGGDKSPVCFGAQTPR